MNTPRPRKEQPPAVASSNWADAPSMTARCRILVTTSDFVGRGAERELANLLKWLPRDRFELHLCLWRNVFDYPCPTDIPVTILGKSRPWHVMRTIKRFRSLHDEWRPDVVFSQLNYVSTVTGSALAKARHQSRWLARLAGNPDVEIRFPVLAWTRRSLQRADVVAGCSSGASASVVRHLHVRPERVVTLPNVVDVDWVQKSSREESPIQKPAGKTVFVHAGRCVPQKDQATLIRAFAGLKHRDSELWMLGVGPLRDRLARLAGQLGVADRLRWLGFHSNPYPIFHQADAFVLSSRYEGLPNVLIESMLCGTPVISTDCPYGPSDLINDNVTGRLVPIADVESLSMAMDSIASDPSHAAKMGIAAAAEMSARFSPSQIVPLYAECLETLGGGKQR